ncbi:YfiT family bacillithiol transferase [Robertkochia aurantiaca]|uniref:YfiT family bacillithiol transferase n=1 Tax=Robertkochia aurantiaca TaxID=2873700 RepID=UPI001CCC5E36|nr:putative metal-dependent hydrolase [Robertkochia sp. 3YJGBD-33]
MIDGDLEQLRYPIGRFSIPETVSDEALKKNIKTITDFPEKLKDLVVPFTPAQLSTPYRPGGWTVSQLVHHLSDSHVNAYIRFKWTLTEDKPEIKVYKEALWAELPDSKNTSIEPSLAMLTAIHHKWSVLLRLLAPSDFDRQLIHPGLNATVTLRQLTYQYGWHCRHHYAHLYNLSIDKGWLPA